VKITRRN